MSYDKYIPHEYMDGCGYPELHECGNSSLQFDPAACIGGERIPIHSTLGRGPRGFGNIASVTKEDESTFIIQFNNDETQELLFVSPNLHAGKITVTKNEEDHTITLWLTRGESTTELCTVSLPQGDQGSRVIPHNTNMPIHTTPEYIYEFPFDELVWTGEPEPRIWDVVLSYVVNLEDENKSFFAAGTILAVEEREGTKYAIVKFHTFCSLDFEQLQADYEQTDDTKVDYIKNRENIQRKLKIGKYISLDNELIDVTNFATDADILKLFNKKTKNNTDSIVLVSNLSLFKTQYDEQINDILKSYATQKALDDEISRASKAESNEATVRSSADVSLNNAIGTIAEALENETKTRETTDSNLSSSIAEIFSALEKKSPLLKQGDNIILTPQQDGSILISSTGGSGPEKFLATITKDETTGIATITDESGNKTTVGGGVSSVSFSEIKGNATDNNSLKTELQKKQDELTEGDNITILNNVVSVSGYATSQDIKDIFN